MYIDLLVFAAIAAFLVYRLMSVLGTRNGAERERPNPFAGDEPASPQKRGNVIDLQAIPVKKPVFSFGDIVDETANKDGRVETGLSEIATADAGFDMNGFIQGARYAFDMIVTAYTKGDIETLKPLLSPKLLADFTQGIKAREAKGYKAELTVHRILRAKVIEAHLGGTMAYITVDFDVEETTVTRDAAGAIVDGHPDHIFSVEDIWTFTRDTRSGDPNWMLIETRAPDPKS